MVVSFVQEAIPGNTGGKEGRRQRMQPNMVDAADSYTVQEVL